MKSEKMGVFALMVLVIVLSVGSAYCLDVGFDFQRDVLHMPGSDSTVTPAAVLASTDLHLGGSAWLRARAGYSCYYNWMDPENGESQERRSDGIRLQAIPMAVVATPLENVAFLFGAGVGGRWQSERLATWHPFYWGVPVKERSIWAIDQTFMLGLRLDVSKRFALEVQAEREGLCACLLLAREYTEWRGNLPVENNRVETFSINWVDAARTGLGIGLRVKL